MGKRGDLRQCGLLLKDLKKGLAIRRKALSQKMQGVPVTKRIIPYELHDGHWMRDLMTAESVLNFCATGKKQKEAKKLLKMMPK